MNDEIKVNSENTPRKNLATLGQVKDALDKRDEKIDSLNEDLGNIHNSLFDANLLERQNWTSGAVDGNGGDELTFLTSSIWLGRYKYLLFETDKRYLCEVKDGYILTLRFYDDSRIVTNRINNITTYVFEPNSKCAIVIESTSKLEIKDIDINTVCTFTTDVPFGDVKERLSTLEIKTPQIDLNTYEISNIENVLNGDKLVKNPTWLKGLAEGNVGSKINIITSSTFINIRKYCIFKFNNTTYFDLKDNYTADIRLVDEENTILKYCGRFINNNRVVLEKGIYAISIWENNSENIADLEPNGTMVKIVSNTIISKEITPYPYSKNTSLIPLHSGDTTRRVQGGDTDGVYYYYAQPATDESENTKLVKYDLTTNEIVSTNESRSYGHAGDLCYNANNNTLVIISNGTYKTWTLSVVNADTLEFVQEITLTGDIFYGITYDKNEHRYIIQCPKTNDSYQYYFIYLNDNFEKIGYSWDAFVRDEKLGGQGICCDDKYLYCSYSYYERIDNKFVFHNSMIVYDKNGHYVGCHKIGSNKEIENVGIANGVLYGMTDGDITLYKINRVLDCFD